MKLILAAAYLCLAAEAAWADTGNDLVQVCGQSASLCSSDFQSDQIVALLRSNRCIPASPAAAEQPVVDWLAKNPKTARRELVKAVGVAVKTLWPCKDKGPGKK